MTSAIATTVGCGGLPFRPSSTAPTGRPRGRWVVRAQAAGADASDDKSVEIMRKFSEQYARRSNTYFCADKTVTAVVIKGLADHKDTLGAPLCPCRHYDDKAAEVAQGFWNCPCVPMRERRLAALASPAVGILQERSLGNWLEPAVSALLVHGNMHVDQGESQDWTLNFWFWRKLPRCHWRLRLWAAACGCFEDKPRQPQAAHNSWQNSTVALHAG
ncbi:ferredoxin-thioredoxin reductase catalytic chain, chloroplastic [Panicum miliaceum]|uniref:Ferredoxin-thioredoxin reductase catalytic chain, chloroplastic n=1 Tax=Panicum miliaceum TaxID=4540 RepID=A0A3L6S2A0_PANMI|nr:ferredoxin-thioredoxin reductase catalytic chain, chloroplastic [Panicum miliaceum]